MRRDIAANAVESNPTAHRVVLLYPSSANVGSLVARCIDRIEALPDHCALSYEGYGMRQTIQRETLKSHFVPNTGVGSSASVAQSVPVVQATPKSGFGRIALRTASKIFWAVAGEKAFTKAMSQHGVSGALLSGSLAAGTVYAQERVARRAPVASAHAISKRSLFSFYAAIGMGLGLGAMLVNKRRG